MPLPTTSDAPLSLGAWCSLPSPHAVEVLSRAGFDWLCVDAQHGLMDRSDVVDALRAADVAGVPAFVRTASQDAAELMHCLDAGAAGVIAPLVNSAAEARAVAGACRYPPRGGRSWGPARPQLTQSGYTTELANERIVCGVQIETMAAVERLDEILAVDGVDLVLVGPNDLALDLGLTPGPGIRGVAHAEAVTRIADACARHGVVAAVFGGSVASALEFIPHGYRMLVAATDTGLLATGAAAALAQLRAV